MNVRRPVRGVFMWLLWMQCLPRCREAIFTCSKAALAKAATIKDRGYYFDFVEFQNNAEKSMTPSTPSIGHVHALASKLEDILPKVWRRVSCVSARRTR